MRQIVLDTETTGLDIQLGHRIVEIGCVEIVDRRITKRYFHKYINPGREIDKGAMDVHGLTNEFLSDKPIFSSILGAFLEFIEDSELIIHNAAFDLGFLENEIKIAHSDLEPLRNKLPVIDSLELARAKHPGQKNSLDALCKRYGVDNSQRQLHGALLDAEILAEVYLLLTGGQTDLGFTDDKDFVENDMESRFLEKKERSETVVIRASIDEMRSHETKLDHIDSTSENGSIWRRTIK
ncbi:MAG: DNA polymerase III subunit epsilon [Gammaproteobacteria bacterium]|nr:DNA polymerase III subunit epsilon [Gammaproteobacteria bacterium]